nr:helix-turn-helix domain-containing protein [uncultured Oscillibacter sp.]
MNNIAETIKQAREARGLTQEDLAEKCGVSRQAVSKWELGVSVPTEENLNILEEVLGVVFEPEADKEAPAKPRNPWRTAAIALGILTLTALVSFGVYAAASNAPDTPEPRAAAPEPTEPTITGIWFFGEDGTPLEPDRGDGWKSFTVGQRVYLLVSFQQGTETGVQGVSLFATPTGTETYDQREQLAVQAIVEQPFALFPLDFPEETMVHLDVTLECDGGRTVTETLNVIALPVEEIGSQSYEFESYEEAAGDGSVIGKVLYDASTFPISE